MSSLGNGHRLIADERIRQIDEEGWTPEHDDQHVNYELRRAARCYALPGLNATSKVPEGWPWAPEWWKPSDHPLRNIVRAGALIAAEIDRMLRQAGEPVEVDKPAVPGHPVGCLCQLCVTTRLQTVPLRKCDECGREFNPATEGAAFDSENFYCVPCGRQHGII